MNNEISICCFCKKEKEIVFDDFGCIACSDCYLLAIKATAKQAEEENFKFGYEQGE